MLWLTLLMTGAEPAPIVVPTAPPPVAKPAKRRSEEPLRYYPLEASKQNVRGYAAIDCHLLPTGKLDDCRVALEQPTGLAFGESALRMAPLFTMTRKTKTADGRVRIPVKFVMSGMVTINPIKIQLTHGSGGKASVVCRVTADDRFADCQVLDADQKLLGALGVQLAARLDAPKGALVGEWMDVPFTFNSPDPASEANRTAPKLD
jgi:TonB family protein